MFTPPSDVEREERRRRWRVLAITAIGFAVIGGLVLYWSARRTTSGPAGSAGAGLTGFVAAGSPEFEAYRRFVTVENQEATQAQNLIGQKQVVVYGVLTNRGSRTLTGVQVRAIVYDMENRPVAERTAFPIPRRRPSLGPNESMVIQVNVDNVPPKAELARFEIVVEGLRFQ
ncbi:hypothetical protein HRbin10_00432 [bacterium HR10]|nr:hypothetical protein HRbin10_00432 [bacterium HR10]